MTPGVIMRRHPTFRTTVIGVAAAVAAAVSVNGIAQAITENNFIYATPKTDYYTVTHMDMTAASNSGNYAITFSTGLISFGTNCFASGVRLPQNATITALTVYYRSGATGDVFVELRRNRLSDGASTLIATRTFVDDSGTRTAGNVPVNANNAVIKNNQYLYGLGLCMDTSDIFYGARIAYEYTSAGG